MQPADTTKLHVDEIVERVCAGVAARRGIVVEEGRTATAAVRAALRVSNVHAERLAGSAEQWALKDFLVLPDHDFIDAAYRVLLLRRADPGGAQHYLAALHSGAMDRAQVLGRLRYSAEGRRCGVAVKGLFAAFVLAQLLRMPGIGWLAAARRSRR
jgi:O-antigen chain-terminating methyltransferase